MGGGMKKWNSLPEIFKAKNNITIVFGMGSIAVTGAGQSIAWQAHIGGFLAGLVLFSLFDPVGHHGEPLAAPTPEQPSADVTDGSV